MIPDPVRKFIAEHIDSVEQLEVLILLRANRDRAFTVSEVNDRIKSSATSVEGRLSDLTGQGFLQHTDRSYRYEASPEVDATVADLASAYAERRVSVIELIFSKPTDKLRAFADAFKVGKKRREPDG